MSVRRIAMGGAAQPESGREQPRRQRLGRLTMLSLGGGGIAGALAFIVVWVPTIYALAGTNTTVPQLAAKSLFPAAAPIHQTVDVYDPAVYRAPQQQAPVQAQPTPSQSPRPSQSPQPSGSPQPSPSPHHDD